MPTTLCFDLDNTLLDDDASLYACVRRVCDELVPRLGPFDSDALTRLYIGISDGFWANRPYDVASLPEARLRFWTEVLAAIGCHEAQLALEARDAYACYRYEFAMAYEDSRHALDRLHGRYRLAVITNGVGEQQRARLDSAGLTPFFDVVVAATDVDTGKPDPAIFQHALDFLGASPAETWHIGDSLKADVQGARNAGLDAAVWLNRTGAPCIEHGPQPDHEIQDLHGLLALLETCSS